MSAESLLVARRAGMLIGVAAASVVLVEGQPAGGRGVALRLRDGGEVPAESVEALAARCEVRPLGRAVARRFPAGARGLALYAGRPVIVLRTGRA